MLLGFLSVASALPGYLDYDHSYVPAVSYAHAPVVAKAIAPIAPATSYSSFSQVKMDLQFFNKNILHCVFSKVVSHVPVVKYAAPISYPSVVKYAAPISYPPVVKYAAPISYPSVVKYAAPISYPPVVKYAAPLSYAPVVKYAAPALSYGLGYGSYGHP